MPDNDRHSVPTPKLAVPGTDFVDVAGIRLDGQSVRQGDVTCGLKVRASMLQQRTVKLSMRKKTRSSMDDRVALYQLSFSDWARR
ncbi:MAG: hypothetical protein ACREXR_17575 [Gammaproteobacteria bacterium]